MRRKALGTFGERVAEKYLQKIGYRILEKNFTCPLGEIDLIAEDAGVLVFIEVRTRSTKRFGTPAESINRKKKQRLIRLASFYLSSRQAENRTCRFDVVAVEVTDKDREKVEITLFKNAFNSSI